MRTYRAYDQCIGTDVSLPELPVAPGEPDVVIRRGDLPVRAVEVPGTLRHTSPDGRVRVYDAPDGTYCFCDGTGTVRVRRGDELVFDTVPGTDVERVRWLLLGPGLRLVLAAQGRLVVHAGAVRVGEHAALFVGESGAGKSTTVAAFAAHGHEVLSDDLVPLYRDGGYWIVPPGVPHLQLDHEAADAVGWLPDRSSFGGPGTYYDIADRFATDTCRLARVYVLAWADEPRLEPLDPGRAVFELRRASDRPRRPSDADADTETIHFRACARVARDVAVTRLGRPRSLRRLPEVVRLVETDLDG